MNRVSDFRSDTVTRPSEEMRRAIAAAPVGDDGFSDDPTVKELEGLASEITGKEAALFVPTGTMGNQIAVAAHTNPGDEILVEDMGHIAWFEGGGAALNSFVQIRTYQLEDRRLEPERAERLLRLPIMDCPPMKLLCVENTLNMYGGVTWPVENLRELKTWAQGKGLGVHLDGARLFNAACADELSVEVIANCADSVMFCLSKGLGAPIGSLLLGTREFIEKSKRVRKRLGGQMRQVGILAAAGLHALEHGVERLSEDHSLARHIAHEIQEEIGVLRLKHEVQSNILIFEVPDEIEAQELCSRLSKDNVLICPFPGQAIRIVTHRDVGEEDASRLIYSLKKSLASPNIR